MRKMTIKLYSIPMSKNVIILFATIQKKEQNNSKVNKLPLKPLFQHILLCGYFDTIFYFIQHISLLCDAASNFPRYFNDISLYNTFKGTSIGKNIV